MNAQIVVKFSTEFNECESDRHGCSQRCINTLGGYRCDCEIGYELSADGKTCDSEFVVTIKHVSFVFRRLRWLSQRGKRYNYFAQFPAAVSHQQKVRLGD